MRTDRASVSSVASTPNHHLHGHITPPSRTEPRRARAIGGLAELIPPRRFLSLPTIGKMSLDAFVFAGDPGKLVCPSAFYCPNLPLHAPITLSGEEARHLARVCRLGPGASIELFDGAGLAIRPLVRELARDSVLPRACWELDRGDNQIMPAGPGDGGPQGRSVRLAGRESDGDWGSIGCSRSSPNGRWSTRGARSWIDSAGGWSRHRNSAAGTGS